MNNLRIYANPKTYILKVIVENSENDIELKNNNVEITINSCNDYQINMYDKNGILYCENPKCKSSCPVLVSAICETRNKNQENVNNVNENLCQCYPGWEGINCDVMKYVDFR